MGILLWSSFCLLLHVADCQTACEKSWSYYGSCGVHKWNELIPTCDGQRQSPIDLPELPISNARSSSFMFTNFHTTMQVSSLLRNTGVSAEVKYLSGDLRVSSGDLPGEFKVEQFHFHWGVDNSRGSEHVIEGVAYPMEMHIVLYNVNYGDFKDAMKYQNGIAVLAMFFQVGQSDNSNYEPIISALEDVREPGKSTDLDPVPLIALLPKDTATFYRYSGSFTTPLCTEGVTWTLFRQPVDISSRQLAEFRKLNSKDPRNEPLVDNFRPIQDLNGRPIDFYH